MLYEVIYNSLALIFKDLFQDIIENKSFLMHCCREEVRVLYPRFRK